MPGLPGNASEPRVRQRAARCDDRSSRRAWEGDPRSTWQVILRHIQGEFLHLGASGTFSDGDSRTCGAKCERARQAGIPVGWSPGARRAPKPAAGRPGPPAIQRTSVPRRSSGFRARHRRPTGIPSHNDRPSTHIIARIFAMSSRRGRFFRNFFRAVFRVTWPGKCGAAGRDSHCGRLAGADSRGWNCRRRE